MTKESIRKEIKTARNMLGASAAAEKSAAAQKLLFETKRFKKAEHIMTYLSFGRELDTHEIVKKLFAAGKTVSVPVVSGAEGELSLRLITPETRFEKSLFGIDEPIDAEETSPSEPDLILVPGVVFDSACRRIGFGGGYYDRLLRRSGAYKIGLCYDFQLLEEIPSEKHDVPVDMLITETKILRRNNDAF